MTEQSHTPGPWQAVHTDPAEGYDCWWITANHRHNFEKEIATVGGGAGTSGANANLIAAAPELLAACKAMLKYMDDGYLVRSTNDDDKSDWALRAIPFVKDLGAMHAAIAKATRKHDALT